MSLVLNPRRNMSQTKLQKTMIVGLLVAVILVLNVSIFGRVRAETGEGKDVFKATSPRKYFAQIILLIDN